MINITVRLIQLVALISIVLLQFTDARPNTVDESAIEWLSCMMAAIIILIEFCKELKSH